MLCGRGYVVRRLHLSDDDEIHLLDMPVPVSAVLVALVIYAASASAIENRVEFITLRGETRLAQSEVCFFPADANDAFFGRYLSTDDVRCLSADAVINLPPGLFNVFARNGTSLIDSHPTFIDNANPGEPGYRAVALPLDPAATLEVSDARSGLREGEWLAVYLTNESRRESLATIHPVPRGDKKILVPADMPFVPMVVRRGAIMRVGKAMQLRAGETKSLAKIAEWGSGRDVIALLRTDALTSPDVPAEAPVVELNGLRPMFAPRDAGRFEGSLAIFKDVPIGTHSIRLSGEGWRTDESSVTVASDATPVTTASPLFGRIAATVEVHASIGELAAVAGGVHCPDDKAPAPGTMPMLRLMRCEGIGGDRRCTAVHEQAFEADQPELTAKWSDLESGTYLAEVGYPYLNDRSMEVDVRPGKSAILTVALHPGTVTGRVTMGGSPVQAVVWFDQSIARALSDESGNYTALVLREPKRGVVMVRMCGIGAYRYFPKDPIGKVLDIDVPKNELVVRVVDEQARPMKNVRVMGGPMFPEDDAVYAYLPLLPTDAAGETRVRNVATDATVEMCAEALGYAKGCTARFTMGDRARQDAVITLRPQPMMHGKLLSNKPFLEGWIKLVSPDGVVVDTSYITPEGEFDLRRSVPGEYLVVVSASHPLTVLELPLNLPAGVLELTMPTQSRTITVALSPKSRRRRVSLELAGRIIPASVLITHQSMSGRIHELEPGETLEFANLGPGSLVVYSVPVMPDFPPEWKNVLDPMEHPHLRVALPRFAVTGPVVPIE